MTSFSPLFPGTDFAGVRGSMLPTTRNANLGSWTAIPNGTTLNAGDLVQYNGSTYSIVNTHLKDASTVAPNTNNDYALYASQGAAGLNNATIYIYQRSVSTPTLPSATVTYTFSPPGLTGLTNGWTTTIPAGTDPLYVATSTASSVFNTDTVASNEWSTPVVLANNGTSGLNNATIYLYQRSTSAPSNPSVSTTYTFSTASLATPNNGWSQTIPAGTDPLYITVATASNVNNTDTIAPAEWATPVVMSSNGNSGSSGLNVATVFLHKRATSTPAVPSASCTYNFTTGTLSGQDNGWTQTVPATNGQPLYVTTATASSITSTDVIASTEWAAPTVLAQDGSNGLNTSPVFIYKRSAGLPSLPTSTTTFTFSTGGLSGLDNGWTQTVPGSNGLPLYVSTASAASTGTTDTITPVEWATPTVLAQDGSPGSPGAAGLNVASVFLYRRSPSVPTKPSTTTTFTFSTGAATGQDNSWTQTIPGGTDPLYVITATASSTGATDTITSAEWAAPVVLAQNGGNGSPGAAGLNNATLYAYRRSATVPNGPDGGVIYTFSTGLMNSEPGNGWTRTIPEGSDPLYVVVATASSSGATDTVLANEWSTPVLWVKNGAEGTGEFTPVMSSSMSRIGTTFTKAGVTGGWDSGFYSQESYKGAIVSWKFTDKSHDIMVGLNTDPASDHSYTSLDFAIFCQTDGNITVYESGNFAGSGPLAADWSTSDVFSVVHTGRHIEYRRNGVPFKVSTNFWAGAYVLATTSFYLDTSFAAIGGSINSVTFGTITIPGTTDQWKTRLINTTRFGNNYYRTAGSDNDWAGGLFNTTVGGPQSKISTRAWAPSMSQEVIIGLNPDPNTSTHYSDIDYALYMQAGTAYAFSNGSFVATLTTYAADDILSVEHIDSSVVIKRNGTIIYTFAGTVAATTILYGDSATPHVNNGALDVVFTTNNPTNGVNGIDVQLSIANIVVSADYQGATKSAQLPKTSVLKVLEGLADVTSSCTVSITTSDPAIVASYSNTVVSITQANTAGYVDVAVSRAGVSLGSKRIQVTRQLDTAPPAAPTNTYKSGTFSIGANTSYSGVGDLTPFMLLAANSSGVISGSGYIEYLPNSINTNLSSTYTAAIKLMIRAPGGTWVDMGSGEATGSNSRRFADGETTTVGSANVSATRSGLTPGFTYEIGISTRMISSSNANSANGSFSSTATQ